MKIDDGLITKFITPVALSRRLATLNVQCGAPRKSFVQSIQRNKESDRIVDAVLGLARSLGMPAVAKGIEDQAALYRLAGKGCQYGQGFHFGKAMSANRASAFLQETLKKLTSARA